MRSTVALAIMVVGLALLMPSCKRLDFFKRTDSLRNAGPSVGAPAPDFDLEDFNGQRVKLSDYRGKVVVLVFWFSKCPPCKAMIPHERELVERHRDQPFALLGLYCAQDYDAARQLMAERNISWPILKADEAIMNRYGVTGCPTVFVLDASGVLRYSRVNGAHLDSAVATLLAE